MEGMVGAGLPKGLPDQGVVQWCYGELCLWRCSVANVIAIDSEREVVVLKHLTECGFCRIIVCIAKVLFVVLPEEVHVIGGCYAWPCVGFPVLYFHYVGSVALGQWPWLQQCWRGPHNAPIAWCDRLGMGQAQARVAGGPRK